MLDAGFAQRYSAALLVKIIILCHKARDDLVSNMILVRFSFCLARNDEGCPRLVNQDGIDLINNRKMVPALDHVLDTEFQIVAQIIKAEFVIRAIGDVSTISLATFVICQIAGNASNAHPQTLIDTPHPAGVARRQIVIDGNNMYSLAVQRVQKDSKRCDKGLALTSFHFRNLARMKCDATH